MQFKELKKQRSKSGRIEIEVVVDAGDVDVILSDFYEALAEYCSLEIGTAWKTVEAHINSLMSEESFRELRRDFVINRATNEALRVLELTPILSPKIHALAYPSKGTEYSYEVAIVERPVVALTSYEPVEVEMEEIVATDEYVARRVAEFLDRYATYEESVPHSVQRGDHVMIDITTTINGGVAVPRLTGKKMIFDIDSGEMPPSFIDKMLGMEVGESKVISFETERQQALSSEDVDSYISNVTLLSQQKKNDVELTDEWVVKNHPQVGTVDEFLVEMRKDIEQEIRKYSQDTLAHLVNCEIEKRLEGTFADDFYQASYKTQMDAMEKDLGRQGKTLDDYFEENETNEQEFTMKMLIKSGESLRQSLALEALFNGRKMHLADSDIKNASKKLFASDPADFSELKKSGRFHLVESAAKRTVALRWLVDTARVSVIEPSE